LTGISTALGVPTGVGGFGMGTMLGAEASSESVGALLGLRIGPARFPIFPLGGCGAIGANSLMSISCPSIITGGCIRGETNPEVCLLSSSTADI
jgi:hypothetical protein